MLTPKNAKAYAVLSILCSMLDEEQWKSLYIEPYLNGRENGFAVTDMASSVGRKAVFAENRNSDNIVVYSAARWGGFSMQGNTPDEAIWNSRSFFDHDDYVKAATFIMGVLFGDK